MENIKEMRKFSLKQLNKNNRKSYIKIEDIREDFGDFLENQGLTTWEKWFISTSPKFKEIENRQFQIFLENSFYLQVTQKFLDKYKIDYKLKLILSTEKDEDMYVVNNNQNIPQEIMFKINKKLQEIYYDFFKDYYTI